MKKNLTTWAAAAFALCGLKAQAQISLDGIVSANEIGTGTAKYVSLGAFTPAHVGTAGFGFQGLLRMYAATSSTKLYVALAGSIEPGGNNFQLYLDVPGRTGVPAGTLLPNIAGNGTAFATDPNDPNKSIGGTKMEMDVDLAIALTGGGDVQTAVFSSATTAVAKSIGGGAAILNDGTPNTTSGATGVYAPFAGTRVSYLISTPDINANPGSRNGGGAGSYAVEYEFNRASLGMANPAAVVRLMAAYVSGDAYWSSDVIPEVTGNGNNNLGFKPDFTALAGTQVATFSGVLSSRTADAVVLGLNVFPNPSQGQAAIVSYRVLDRAQPVAVRVMDLLGRQVKTLLDQAQNVGTHNLAVPAGTLAAGTYLVQVRVGDKTATSKLVVTE